VEAIRIILHGKAAGDARVRTAVLELRQNGHPTEVRVTWEPGDAARLTAEAVADAGAGEVSCIVAGGGDGTINEVFATAYGAGLTELKWAYGYYLRGHRRHLHHSIHTIPPQRLGVADTAAPTGRALWFK
jgi:Diacylglycerol kinase catalytic domain